MRTLRSREIDSVFRAGRRAGTPLLLLIAADTPVDRPDRGRVAFIAGKKVGGAVTRNRLKRVLREAVRQAGGPWPGQDVLLVARAGLSSAKADQLQAALSSALGRLGLS